MDEKKSKIRWLALISPALMVICVPGIIIYASYYNLGDIEWGVLILIFSFFIEPLLVLISILTAVLMWVKKDPHKWLFYVNIIIAIIGPVLTWYAFFYNP